MTVPLLLRKRQARISLKGLKRGSSFLFSYRHLKSQLYSKFHLSKNDIKFRPSIIEPSLPCQINHVNDPDLTELVPNIDNTLREIACPNLFNELSPSRDLDWTRGRFIGRLIKLVLRNGVIVEKVYISAKGNRISIKINELGIFKLYFLNHLFRKAKLQNMI